MSFLYASLAILLVAMATRVEASSHYQLNRESCEYQGRMYQSGEDVETGRCEYCTCNGWSIGCVVPYCPPPPCVDSVPGDNPKCSRCGRKCPNGPNCAGPSGEVIPAGDEGLKVGDKTCRCVETRSWGSRLASLCE